MLKKIIFLYFLSCNSYALISTASLLNTENNFNLEKTQSFVIKPVKEGWFNASPVDIEAVSQSAATTLLKYMPVNLKLDTIILKNSQKGPITLFHRGAQQAHIILVNIEGMRWAQLAYQFSHELCHVLSNYEETKKDANQWFEEALCEGASIHTVNRMSQVWKTNPPYSSWQSYASNLGDYYENIMAEQHRYLQPEDSIANWYQREKKSLRLNAEQRHKNEIIGTKIYLFFKDKPERWRSMKYINLGNTNNQITLKQYLHDWENNLPIDLKYVAKTISDWFGY